MQLRYVIEIIKHFNTIKQHKNKCGQFIFHICENVHIQKYIYFHMNHPTLVLAPHSHPFTMLLLRSLTLMATCCTAGKTPPGEGSRSRQKTPSCLTCASSADPQWVSEPKKKERKRHICPFTSSITFNKRETHLTWSLYKCLSLGSGKVPDQLVNLIMKHGVEAKNEKEVGPPLLPDYFVRV